MAAQSRLNIFISTILFLSLIHLVQSAAVVYDHVGSDVLDVTPPFAGSGYTVPTQGAFESLPPPRPGFVLTKLALARGNLNYSCQNREHAQTPVYTSQFTTLWDAAPLLPHIADESQFHTIIPQLFDFNYADISNSSLTCMGTIFTVQSQPVVDLFGIGMIHLNVEQTIQGPDQGSAHLEWAYEVSVDQTWDIYRVETVSDALPETCDSQGDNFSLNYAAEYWFFHA